MNQGMFQSQGRVSKDKEQSMEISLPETLIEYLEANLWSIIGQKPFPIILELSLTSLDIDCYIIALAWILKI